MKKSLLFCALLVSIPQVWADDLFCCEYVTSALILDGFDTKLVIVNLGIEDAFLSVQYIQQDGSIHLFSGVDINGLGTAIHQYPFPGEEFAGSLRIHSTLPVLITPMLTIGDSLVVLPVQEVIPDGSSDRPRILPRR